MGLSNDARTAEVRPGPPTSKHLRRAKLVAAFGVTALVGIGSYAGTYRALVVVSTPSTATGSVTPAPAAGSTATVPAPAPPAHPLP